MSNRAVIYARYSSHSQNEQSIETQVEICKSYAKRHNLEIVHIDYVNYILHILQPYCS